MQKATLSSSSEDIGRVNQVIITTNYRIDETGASVDEDITNKLYAGVSGFFAEEMSRENFFTDESDEAIGLVGSRVVGPTIADDIKTGAIYSIIFSLIVVFLYILGRFRKWQFSLGAVAALLHDVLFCFGIVLHIRRCSSVPVGGRPSFHCGHINCYWIFIERYGCSIRSYS